MQENLLNFYGIFMFKLIYLICSVFMYLWYLWYFWHREIDSYSTTKIELSMTYWLKLHLSKFRSNQIRQLCKLIEDNCDAWDSNGFKGIVNASLAMNPKNEIMPSVKSLRSIDWKWRN